MTDTDVIQSLGDVTVLARLLGVPKSTLANWKARGIPWQMRPKVQALARRKKVKLPANFLMERALAAIEQEKGA